MVGILGVIVGFVAFGIVWFFLLKPKNNQTSSDELKLKEEELKKSQIYLATKEAEIKAAEDAKKDLTKQLNDKKVEVTNLYKKVDGIVDGVGEYKSISEKHWIIEANAQSDIRETLFQLAVSNKLSVLGMQQEQRSLEEVFKELTR